MARDKKQSYGFICFTGLAYEFNISGKKENKLKLKGGWSITSWADTTRTE